MIDRENAAKYVGGLRDIAGVIEHQGLGGFSPDKMEKLLRVAADLVDGLISLNSQQGVNGPVDFHPAVASALVELMAEYRSGPPEGVKLQRWAHAVQNALHGVVDSKHVFAASARDVEDAA